MGTAGAIPPFLILVEIYKNCPVLTASDEILSIGMVESV